MGDAIPALPAKHIPAKSNLASNGMQALHWVYDGMYFPVVFCVCWLLSDECFLFFFFVTEVIMETWINATDPAARINVQG